MQHCLRAAPFHKSYKSNDIAVTTFTRRQHSYFSEILGDCPQLTTNYSAWKMQRWKPTSGVLSTANSCETGFTGNNNLRPPETTEGQHEAHSHVNVYPALPLGKRQRFILMVVSNQKTSLTLCSNLQIYFPGFKQRRSRFEMTTSSVLNPSQHIITWTDQATRPCSLLHVFPHLERGDIIPGTSTNQRHLAKRLCVARWSLRKDFPATSDPWFWAPRPNIRRDEAD